MNQNLFIPRKPRLVFEWDKRQAKREARRKLRACLLMLAFLCASLLFAIQADAAPGFILFLSLAMFANILLATRNLLRR